MFLVNGAFRRNYTATVLQLAWGLSKGDGPTVIFVFQETLLPHQ